MNSRSAVENIAFLQSAVATGLYNLLAQCKSVEVLGISQRFFSLRRPYYNLTEKWQHHIGILFAAITSASHCRLLFSQIALTTGVIWGKTTGPQCLGPRFC